jgi:hypothetical protein
MLFEKITKAKRVGGLAQMVLAYQVCGPEFKLHYANPSLTKRKKKGKEEENKTKVSQRGR